VTDKTTTVKTKNSVLGTLLTVAATAVITVIAVKKQKQIVDGINAGMTSAAALAQKMADGSFKPLTPDKQNGGRHAAGAAV
jgi:hypothetical protein